MAQCATGGRAPGLTQPRFRPSPYEGRQGGSGRRIAANLAAISIAQRVQAVNPRALEQEKNVMSSWSGWGGLSELFDEDSDRYAAERERLRGLIGEDGYRQARAGVLSQFFTPGHIVEAVWGALSEAGVTAGHGLEPGCGSGHFIGHAPDGVRMTGIEVDPTTAGIAQALYPEAQIRAEGYETTPTTELFDFAVGNVPYGEVRLHDRANNPGNHTMHNHFIIKALSQTKPGGYVAVLTTHHTLDASNPAARRDMHERADLVSAVRLPSNTFTPFTSTQVVSDLLVFRVRKDGEEPAPFTWEHARPTAMRSTRFDDEAEHQVMLNDAVVAGEVTVLGSMSVEVGMYGVPGLRVRSPLSSTEDNTWNLAAVLREQLDADLAAARGTGLGYAPEEVGARPVQAAPADAPIGTIRVSEDGFVHLTGQGWSRLHVPATQTAQLTALLELRDRTRTLLDTEVTTRGDSPDLAAQRTALAAAVDAYVERFGPLNACKRSASVRVNGDGEEVETVRRTWPGAMRIFMSDPSSALTRAIEVYDEDTGTAEHAPLLRRRQVFAAYEPKGADSPADAVAICRSYKGRVDLGYCTYLLGGTDTAETREALGDLVFDTPEGDLVTREEYLSGNVRAKLEAAQAAAVDEPAMQANVEALRSVLPRDLGVADVVPSVGATWVEPGDYCEFLSQILKSPMSVTYNPVDGWKVTGTSRTVESTHVYGSTRMPAAALFEDMLNAKPIKVTTRTDEGRTVLDAQATEVARGHAERLDEAFSSWLFRDPVRTHRLLIEYNRRFNSLAPRSYDEAGARLELPGLADHFTLRDHQKAAVARMIAEPTTGLFHEVGAGKTLEMVCGVMEQKRLGLVSKPLVVVPNHMLAQFEREWLQAYPAARLLSADAMALGKEADRTFFMARATTSDWDAIICTQSAFQKLPLRPETVNAWANRRLEEMDSWLASAGRSLSVRGAEAARARLASQLAAQADRRLAHADHGATFEDLGVDYLVVDEAHYYKNLHTQTNTTGILSQESPAKVQDLEAKLDYLRRNHGARVATFATATPIANTMGEMWVMTHYLRPDLLREAGLSSFDEWANTFTSVQSRVEVNTAGNLRVRQRISAFKNMPELTALWSTFADVKRREQLHLPVPDLEVDGAGNRRAHVVTVNVGAPMEEFTASLLERGQALEAGGVDPKVDNYLSLTNDAKATATDYRLLSERSAARALREVHSPFGAQKIDAVAAQVARIYQETKDNVYTDDSGARSPIRGALQMVFCDQGTPKAGGTWSLYDELKSELVESGVPADRIVYIHEAATSVQKDVLFARARSGAISVLIGSTEKMGTGANMQKRAVALHHVTCPWRPCDITQREGRIIRQGNENPEVGIYRYVTEGSFDTFLWQSVERKASFINQVMDAQVTERTMDAVDISDDEADFAQVKALASGNPLEMEITRISNEVTALQRRATQHDREQRYLRGLVPDLDLQARNLIRRAEEVDKVLAQIPDDDEFRMSINHVTYTERTKASAALRTLMSRTFEQRNPSAAQAVRALPIEYKGVTMSVVRPAGARTFEGGLDHMAPPSVLVGVKALDEQAWYFGSQGARLTAEVVQADGVGAIRRIENHVAGLPRQVERLREQAERVAAEKQSAQAQIGAENPWAVKLEQARAQLAALRAEASGLEEGQETLPALGAAEQTRARSIFTTVMQASSPTQQRPGAPAAAGRPPLATPTVEGARPRL